MFGISGFYSIPFKVTLTENRPAWATVREWRSLLKTAHYWMGDYYRRELLPKHFQPGAASKYGYRRRTSKYLDRKEAGGFALQERGLQDLVLTGQFRRSLLEASQVTGYESRMTFRASTPIYAPQRQKADNRQPPIVDEATRILRDERRHLASILRRSILERGQRIAESKTTRIE